MKAVNKDMSDGFVPQIGKKYPALLSQKHGHYYINMFPNKRYREKAMQAEADEAVKAAFPALPSFERYPASVPCTAMLVKDGLTRVWLLGKAEPIDMQTAVPKDRA